MSDRKVDLSKLRLGWNPERTEQLLGRVHTRLNRRKRALRIALTTASMAVAVSLAVVVLRWNHLRSNVSIRTEIASHVERSSIKLHEGSEIELDRGTSEVRVVEESPSRVQVDVVRGSGRYSVVPNPARRFEVRSGAVTVTVVGTEFVVEQRAENTWVEVSRGTVRVSWAGGEALVVAGESGLFPAAAVSEQDDVESPASHSPQSSQVYRSRVARRDYRGAYAELSRNPALAGDTVEDLLVAADVARLSDHPSEAVPYLQRIVRERPRDERAPLAAFTLGRTLSGLGRFRDAMVMFGQVRSRWPQSPLAEDALLRQAEAASQMGDLSAARRIAEKYDRDYPNGQRRSEVRRHAHLE